MSESSWNWKRVLLRHLQNVGRGFDTLDRILRGREAGSPADAGSALAKPVSIKTVIVLMLVLAPIYGVAMGSYAAVAGQRSWTEQSLQMVYSAIKVPLLLTMTVAIAIPSFFVINTLFGLRNQFGEALRAIISAQAGLAIILVSLLPITIFVYVSLSVSSRGYSQGVMFNALVFGIASVSAQVMLRRYYAPLIKRSPRQRMMLRLWILIYAFVGIQAAYVLRPFIGSPNEPTSFFRSEPFENAYVVVFKLLWNLFGVLPGTFCT
ncbi:MAG: hypothetical protein AAFN77_13740 [Planctomycetota bacterium]